MKQYQHESDAAHWRFNDELIVILDEKTKQMKILEDMICSINSDAEELALAPAAAPGLSPAPCPCPRPGGGPAPRRQLHRWQSMDRYY